MLFRKALAKGEAVINVRTLIDVVRHSGLGPLTVVFLVLFFGCSLVVWLADPSQKSLGDGMWFCFQVVSTIGFGDVEATLGAARAVSVVLSVFSIFYIAIVTGVVVSYVTETLKVNRGDMLAKFADSLQRVDKMTPEELSEFAQSVREYRRRK